MITEAEKRTRGQPPHAPTDRTRQTVQVLKANGNPQKVIALVIGVSEDTLVKHYRTELEHGRAQVKAMVGAAVVKSALRGNIGAQRYWLACFGGAEWKHKDLEDGATPNSKTTVFVISTDPVEAAQTYQRLMSSD